MRLYRILTSDNKKFWEGSSAAASKKRTELTETLGCKRKDIEVEQVEVPTNKEGLIEFLNSLNEADDE